MEPASVLAELADPVANTVRPSVVSGEMIMPAQELGTPVAWGLDRRLS
jgi:hypothetical protein